MSVWVFSSFVFALSNQSVLSITGLSPWYNGRKSWLGLKHQITCHLPRDALKSHTDCVRSLCLVLIFLIHFSQGAPKILSVTLRTICYPPRQSVVLPGPADPSCSTLASCRILWLWRFSRYNWFLTFKLHWTTRPLPVCLITSSCMFRLSRSARLSIVDFVLHLLTLWSLLVNAAPSSKKHHFPGTADLPYSLWHSSSVASFKR